MYKNESCASCKGMSARLARMPANVRAAVCAVLLCAGAAFIFAACDFFTPTWNEPIGEWFEKYTNEAAIDRHEFFAPTYADKDGNICIGSEADCTITFYLRNPKKYDLKPAWTAANPSVTASSVSVIQDASDRSIIRMTLPQSFLLVCEQDNKDEERNISPTIHIAQHENGAKIREFADYSFNLFANSKPPELLSPTVLNDENDLNNKKFVVAFRVPHPTEYGFYMRHQDIAKLTIAHASKVWEFPVAVGHNGHITIDEGSDSNGASCTLTTSDEDPSSKSWNAINGKYFPYAKDGLNYYLETNMAASGDAAFTLTLTDSAGLTSSVTASTRMPKLSYPEIFKKGELYAYSNGGSGIVACAQGETTAAFVIKAHTQDVANNLVSGNTTVHWKLYKTTSGQPAPVAENNGSDSNDVTLSIVPGTWRIVSWAEKAGYEKSRTTFVDVTVKPADPPEHVRYVSESGHDNTGNGSESHPFATVNRALTDVNDKNGDWTIYVSGTVSGDAGQYSGTVINGNVLAKSLVIDGRGGANATLTAANKRILVIEQVNGTNPPPVTLKNLTITSSSSGIWVSSPTQVTITDCTIKDMDSDAASIGLRVGNPNSVVTLNGSTKISNCTLRNTQDDCGVVFIAGTLIMKDNACIEENENASGVANSGGGVTVCGGNVFLCGNATIKNNSSGHGGGIYAYDGAKLYIGYTRSTDGKPIAYDNFTGGIFGNTASGAGGGIYLSSSTNDGRAFTCLMHAGSIKGNTADLGGGISLSGASGISDIFTMNGGTIADNTATSGGGAILVHNSSFIIKDNASIPCGPNNTNDVLLSEKRIITIEDELVNHNEGNPIALTLEELENDSAAANGRVVATGVANQSNKFKLLNGYYKLVEETNNNVNRDYKLAMDINKVTVAQIKAVLDGDDASKTDNENQDILDYFSGPKTQRLFLQFSNDYNELIEFYTAFELVFDGRDTITYSHSTTRNSTLNSLTNKTFTFNSSNPWYSVDFDDDSTDDISIHWDNNNNTIWIGQEFVKYYIFN